MHPRIFFFLLTMFTSVSGLVLPTEEDSDPVLFCSDVKWDDNISELQTINCIQRFATPENITADPTDTESFLAEYGDQTVYDEIVTDEHSSGNNSNPLHARFMYNHANNREKGRHATYNQDLPYRSPMLPTSDQEHKSWCFREGAFPTPFDVSELCNSVGKNFDSTKNRKRIFQIQRTRWANANNQKGSCFCTMVREGTAGYKMCNCDRCDALQLDFGVQDVCKALQRDCMGNLYGSGYMRTRNPNALYALYGYPNRKGQQEIELDPVLGVEGVLPSTCNSGDENRRNQDFTGQIIDCSWKDWWKNKYKARYTKEPKQVWNAAYTDN